MPGDKGSYRSVYSAIWDDPEFQAFDPVAQAVFFCLRTSKDCNFPCIFPHYHSTLYERMPNASREAIDTGIDTLIRSGWIRYERPVLWITKGLKNEPSYYANNPKHVAGIVKILHSLPKLKIVLDFAAYYEIPFNFYSDVEAYIDTRINTRSDTPTIPVCIPGTIQGTGTGTGKGKKDLKAGPVDNSNALPIGAGAAVRGAMASAAPPPAPPFKGQDLVGNMSPAELIESIKTIGKQGGV